MHRLVKKTFMEIKKKMSISYKYFFFNYKTENNNESTQRRLEAATKIEIVRNNKLNKNNLPCVIL